MAINNIFMARIECLVFAQMVIMAMASSIPVANVTVEVNPTKTRELLINLIDSQYYSRMYPQLSASQLAMNMNLHEMTLAQFNEVLREAKSGIFQLDLEAILQTLRIKPVPLYKDFIGTLEEPGTQIKQAASVLHLNDVELMMFVLYQPEADTQFYELLKNADLRPSNVLEAMMIFKKSSNQIFEFLKNPIISSLNNTTLLALQNTFNGQNQRQLIPSLMRVMNVTVEGPFLNIIEQYNSSLQFSKLTVATRVSPIKYLTAKNVYNKVKLDPVSKECLRVSLSNGLHINDLEVFLEGNITALETPATEDDFINIKQTDEYINCTYYNFTFVPVTVLSTETHILIEKSQNIAFTNGAPLICQNGLIGIAENETSSHISFAKASNSSKNTSNVLATAMNNYGPSSQSNDDINLLHYNKYLLKVEFTTPYLKTPNLISMMLMNNYHQGGNTNIRLSAGDLIDSYKLKSLSYPQYLKLMEASSKPQNTTNQNFVTIIDSLKDLNISLISTYGRFLSVLVDPQSINGALNALNISQGDLNNILIYYPKNESDFYKIITKGNFTKENTQKSLEAIGISETEIFEFLKMVIFDNIYADDAGNLLMYIRRHGGYEFLMSLVKILNVGPQNFVAPKFIEMLEQHKATLANETSLGIAISAKHIISSGNIHDKWFSNKSMGLVELSATNNLDQRYIIEESVSYSTGYANLTTSNSLVNVIPVSNGSNGHPRECHYVTEDKTVDVKIVTTKNGFSIVKGDSIKYKRGAALICQNMLYGVAIEETKDKIKFAGFKNAKINEAVPASSKSAIYFVSFATIVFNILIVFF